MSNGKYKVTSGTQDSVKLCKRAVPIFDVFQNERTQHNVKRRIVQKSERLSQVGLSNIRRRAEPLLCQFNHFRTSINGNNFSTVFNQPFGINAGPATRVENSFAFNLRHQRQSSRALVVCVMRFCINDCRVSRR